MIRCMSQGFADLGTIYPGNISSGLVLWMDANDSSTITSSGGVISSWADKISSRTFSQATSGQRPLVNTTAFSGLNAVDFNSAKNLVASSSLVLPSTFTHFMVTFLPATPGSYSSVAMLNNAGSIQSGTDFLGYYSIGSPYYLQLTTYQSSGNVNKYADTSTAGGVNSAKALSTFVVDGVPANVKIRRNSTNLTTTSSSPGVSNGLTLNQIGETNGGLYASGGVIGEIVAYNRTLNSTEYDAVESYLKAKWGTP